MAEAILFFILGLMFGSFANVCIWRIPRNEEVVVKPSHCPGCGTDIKWHDNIPLMSFIMLNGKCRSCNARISWQYPMVELICGVLFAVVYLVIGGSLKLAGYLPFVWSMLVISVIDIKHYIIPDQFSLGGLAAGLVFSIMAALGIMPALSVFRPGPLPAWPVLDSLFGILLGGGFLLMAGWVGRKVFKQEAMGGGDVKLAAMIGSFWGWQAVLVSFFAAFLLGSLAGISLLAAGRVKKNDAPEGVKPRAMVPFGPFLALGAVIAMFWGRELMDLYLGLLVR